MTAEILSVGTELLLGNITDTNAAFIAQELAAIGVSVYRKTTVGDNHGRLLAALTHAFDSADMVVISGGLGPTLDDITKAAAGEYFGLPLVLHQASMERIHQRFAGRELPPHSERNAMVPEGCHVLQNNHGSAPGVVVEAKGKTLILLPGPPHEMIPMFTDYALPYISQKSGAIFASQTLKIIGIGESKVEAMLMDLIQTQTNPTIAPYAKVGEVHLRLTAAADSTQQAQALLAPLYAEIAKRLTHHIYTNTDQTLPEVVVALMKENNHTIAVAESCTGGLVVSELVSVAGCSTVVTEGFCTYSNDAKIARLGVPPELLQTHGAVSPQVAAAMAEGVAKVSGTTIGIATTGIAGPDGGTPDKPVGLVYIGVCIHGQTTVTEHRLVGSRNNIRQRATLLALDMVRNAMAL